MAQAQLKLSEELFEFWLDHYPRPGTNSREAAESALSESGQELDWWRGHLTELLLEAEPAAAVVVSVEPRLIACYSGRHDAIVLLRIPASMSFGLKWSPGMRLLGVNSYKREQLKTKPADDFFGYAPIDPEGQYYFPILAEFLSDDKDRLASLKEGLQDEVWNRCQDLGQRALEEQHPARNGHPFNAQLPAGYRWDGSFQGERRTVKTVAYPAGDGCWLSNGCWSKNGCWLTFGGVLAIFSFLHILHACLVLSGVVAFPRGPIGYLSKRFCCSFVFSPIVLMVYGTWVNDTYFKNEQLGSH